MNMLPKILCAAGIVAGSLGTAEAATVINNWGLNASGTGGFAGATTIDEYIDIVGSTFIQITPTGGNNFTFGEYSVFYSPGHDNTPGGYNSNITAVFSATGSGTFGGSFTFATGALSVYADSANNYGSTSGIYGADDGTKIGTFDVVGGGGLVDASGNPVGNGQITVNLQALAPSSLLPGRFFSPTGADLSTGDLLAFSFTNANTTETPNKTKVSEIICQGAGFKGPGCNGDPYANSPGNYIFAGTNGQFKLATVPEPTSIALVGLAFVGASLARRRSVSKRA